MHFLSLIQKWSHSVLSLYNKVSQTKIYPILQEITFLNIVSWFCSLFVSNEITGEVWRSLIDSQRDIKKEEDHMNLRWANSS